MKTLQDLQHEHEIVKHALTISENICERLEGGETLNKNDMAEILEFLTVFVDRCHHSKEEAHLFPAIEVEAKPMIAQMLYEHETGREFVGQIKQAFAAYKSGSMDALPTLIGNLRGYIKLLREHIDKEDHVLYCVAEKLLSQEQDEQMFIAFEAIERERIGAGKHEAFHQMIHRLEAAYVG